MNGMHHERETSRGAFTPTTRSAAVHDRLCAQLCAGELAPGETISIRQIAQQHGCSAMPAREALRGW